MSHDMSSIDNKSKNSCATTTNVVLGHGNLHQAGQRFTSDENKNKNKMSLIVSSFWSPAIELVNSIGILADNNKLLYKRYFELNDPIQEKALEYLEMIDTSHASESLSSDTCKTILPDFKYVSCLHTEERSDGSKIKFIYVAIPDKVSLVKYNLNCNFSIPCKEAITIDGPIQQIDVSGLIQVLNNSFLCRDYVCMDGVYMINNIDKTFSLYFYAHAFDSCGFPNNNFV